MLLAMLVGPPLWYKQFIHGSHTMNPKYFGDLLTFHTRVKNTLV